jgi:hypothetical protein
MVRLNRAKGSLRPDNSRPHEADDKLRNEKARRATLRRILPQPLAERAGLTEFIRRQAAIRVHRNMPARPTRLGARSRRTMQTTLSRSPT